MKNEGVTLISLAVTIVILLILAGISINMVVGENGFITKSRKIKENIELAVTEGEKKINSLKNEEIYNEDGVIIFNDEYAPTINKLEINILNLDSIKINVNITESGSGLAKIEYSIDDGESYVTPNNNQSKTYTFTDLKIGYEEYKIKVKVTDVNNNSSYVSKTIERLKIGDYVNYTYDTSTEYLLTSEVSGYSSDQNISQPDTALKWRILSISDNGIIDLISETPTDTTVSLTGALGYNNGIYALNDMCEKLFSNSNLGISARSVNLEDIEKQETETGTSIRLNYINSSNIKCGETSVYTGSSSYYPNLYSYQKGSGINNIITKTDGINESDITAAGYTMPTAETYSQAGENGLTVTQKYYEEVVNVTNYGEAGNVLASSSSYWVATRYVDALSNVDFGIFRAGSELKSNAYLFHSDKYMNTCDRKLRPVVSLNLNLLDFNQGKEEEIGEWKLL